MAGHGQWREGGQSGLTLSLWLFLEQEGERKEKLLWWSGLKGMVTVTYPLGPATVEENVPEHISEPPAVSRNGELPYFPSGK